MLSLLLAANGSEVVAAFGLPATPEEGAPLMKGFVLDDRC